MKPNWNMLGEYMRSPYLFGAFEAFLNDVRTEQEDLDGIGTWETLIRCKCWSVEEKPQSTSVRFRNSNTGRFSLWREWELYWALTEFLKRMAGIHPGRRPGVGLVLAGGGAKGAYEIGVWRAMRDLGLEPCVKGLSGASIGAVNSLLFARGDLEGAVDLWRRMSDPKNRAKEQTRIEREKLEYTRRLLLGDAAPMELVTNAVFLSQPELKQALIRMASGTGTLLQTRYTVFSTVVPADQVSSEYRIFAPTAPADPLPFAGLWPDFPEAQYYIPWGLLSNMEVADVVLASAAMPMAYAPVKFRGYPYFDGGDYDNLPVYPLYRSGFRKFILVDLKRKPTRSRDWREDQGDCLFVRIQPREDFQDDLGATLKLTPEMTEERMEMGYKDALEQFGKRENKEKLQRMVRDA